MALRFSEVIQLSQDAIPERKVQAEWQGHSITLVYRPGLITPAKLEEMSILSMQGQNTLFNSKYLKNCLVDWDVLGDNGEPYPLPAHAGQFGILVNAIREKLVSEGKAATPQRILALLPEEEGESDEDEELTKQKKATIKQEKLEKIRHALECYDAIDRFPGTFLNALVEAIVEDIRPKRKSGGSFSDS